MEFDPREITLEFRFAALKRKPSLGHAGRISPLRRLNAAMSPGISAMCSSPFVVAKSCPPGFSTRANSLIARAIRHMVKHMVCDQSVEAGIGEGQALRIDNIEGAAGTGNVCSRLRHHARRQVRVCHLPAHGNVRRILLPKPARSAANIGNTRVVW